VQFSAFLRKLGTFLSKSSGNPGYMVILGSEPQIDGLKVCKIETVNLTRHFMD